MGYDLQPLVTLADKTRLLQKAYDEKWMLFFEHDPSQHTLQLQKPKKDLKQRIYTMISENKEFIKICSLKDLIENKGKRFFIEENEIAVFLVAGEVFALSNYCPHQHSTLIYDGFLEDDFVVCPAHGWMFNLKTGKTPLGGRGLVTYETIIKGMDVYVEIKNNDWL